MSPIIPAVIPESLHDLEKFFSTVSPFTKDVQVDVVDGQFVPFTSWPFREGDSISSLKEFTEIFQIELDLMVLHPEEVVETYLKTGAQSVVIHIESTRDLRSIHALKEHYDFQLGLSLNNDTDLEELTSVIAYADYVQCMGIKKIGAQGQPFDARVLDRIRALKKNFETLPVSVDGSVNHETLPLIVAAGADRCAVGSALLKAENPSETYEVLCSVFRAHQTK